MGQARVITFKGLLRGATPQLWACEALPRAYSVAKTPALKLLNLVGFVIGAIAIALVLFGHEHCAAGGGHAH